MNQNNLVTHPFPKLATLLFMHSVSFLNWVTCLFFFFSAELIDTIKHENH